MSTCWLDPREGDKGEEATPCTLACTCGPVDTQVYQAFASGLDANHGFPEDLFVLWELFHLVIFCLPLQLVATE